MVCIYCEGKTHVTNSRLQKRTNQVWRRRQCNSCQAIFSSLERIVYEGGLMVQNSTSHITPLQRDKLFLDIYDACRHRPNAISDATALTDTVLSKLLALRASQGLIQRDILVKITDSALKQFDRSAHVHYLAFHSL
jgi:transcriptional regulator NrdR family protein